MPQTSFERKRSERIKGLVVLTIEVLIVVVVEVERINKLLVSIYGKESPAVGLMIMS